MLTSEFLLPYVLSNIIGLVLIVAAILWPKVARGAYVVMFGAAAIINGIMAINNPEMYVKWFGGFALLGFYRDFIQGFFSQHTREVLLAIAFGQLLVAISLTRRGFPFLLGVTGGAIFLIALAPLGVGSALPATLAYSVGLVVLYRRLLRGDHRPYDAPLPNGSAQLNGGKG